MHTTRPMAKLNYAVMSTAISGADSQYHAGSQSRRMALLLCTRSHARSPQGQLSPGNPSGPKPTPVRRASIPLALLSPALPGCQAGAGVASPSHAHASRVTSREGCRRLGPEVT